MFHWRIVRTLIGKELLRYRYNWGLLVLVVALLALSALVAISSRFGRVPLGGAANLTKCRLFYCSTGGSELAQLIADLRQQPLPEGYEIEFRDNRGFAPPTEVQLTPDYLAIIVFTPMQALISREARTSEAWQIRFAYLGMEPPASLSIYRAWLMRVAQDTLKVKPRIEEDIVKAKAIRGIEVKDRVSLVVTALVIFALYLLSFNLYLNSTGEEREKKVLLALLLTPASPLDVIAAKAIFYGFASVAVAGAVVAMYNHTLLANPFLWVNLLLGSLVYVAIATVLVSIVRRQTTISTVSMLYLIGTAVIMLLSDMLVAFIPFRLLLVEHYLHSQMYALLTDQMQGDAVWQYGDWSVSPFHARQAMMVVLSLLWVVAAVIVFGRRSTSLSHSR